METAVSDLRWERYPLVADAPLARSWLQIQSDLGLAPNTIEAYGRALQDYLSFSRRAATLPETARRAHIAAYVRDLTDRPSRRVPGVSRPGSDGGLANATLQQRLVAVRLFYDHLVEEGLRIDNPVGRGRYTPGKGFGCARERGLVPRYQKLPWIPSDEQWLAVLAATQTESVRNRLMLALAYDAALRREELCALEVGDVDAAQGGFRGAGGVVRSHISTTDYAHTRQ
jgi:site-specific recombinase XerD